MAKLMYNEVKIPMDRKWHNTFTQESTNTMTARSSYILREGILMRATTHDNASAVLTFSN